MKESVEMSVYYNMTDCRTMTSIHKDRLSVVYVDGLCAKMGNADNDQYYWKLTNTARLKMLKTLKG